jgi:hypothetical protein
VWELTIIGAPAAAETSCRSFASSMRAGFAGTGAGTVMLQALRCARYSSAIVTSPIIRSYDSRAVSPNEKKPCFISTTPMVCGPSPCGKRLLQSLASGNPGITYGTTITESPYARPRVCDRQTGAE